MTKRWGVFFTIFLSFLSSLSWCREGLLKLPDVYPNAELVETVDEFRRNHPLISGAMKKVNGEIKADSEQWRDGYLLRRVYQVPEGTSSLEAFQYYTSYFRLAGANPVYTCERFQCGDSSFWANNVFNIPMLFGLDKEQAYFIGEMSEGTKKAFVTVYAVKRGNRRTYVLVDVFSEGAKVDDDGLAAAFNNHYQELKNKGFITLPLKEANYQQAADFIERILSNHIRSQVIISISAPLPISLESLDTMALQLTKEQKSIEDALVKKGISKQQFRVISGGVGHRQTSERLLTVTLVSAAL